MSLVHPAALFTFLANRFESDVALGILSPLGLAAANEWIHRLDDPCVSVILST
jgi:hypothetical protein